jgi:multiple sugar transport system substrate-binding protein
VTGSAFVLASGTAPIRDTRIGWTRRKLLGAAAVSGAASLAAACGAGGAAPPSAGSAAADAPAKLLWEIRGGPTYEELVKQGIALFKQKFPRVDIEYFPKEGDWQGKLLAGWASGSGADIFQAWDDNFWRFYANGAIVNINDLLKDYKKSDIDDFVKGQWNGFVIPNTTIRFGMPTYINTGVLYYNKNTFRKAGVKEPDATWTYAEYAEASKRLARNDGGRQLYGNHHPLGTFRTQSTLWAFGGSKADPKDFTKTALHQPEAQQALEWLSDRYWKDQSWLNIGQRPAGFTFYGALGDGLIAMAEDGMHALKEFPKIEGLDFDVAPIPKGPKQRVSWITTDGWGMWRDSKARPQAWELMKFITSVEWYKMQSRIELLIPSRVSLLDDWMQVLRERFPVLQTVNLKGVKDQLTASPPAVSTTQNFLCAADADKIVGDTLNAIFRDGTLKPAAFRDGKEQIDAAAGGCGLSIT